MKALILYDSNGFNSDDEKVLSATGCLQHLHGTNTNLSFGLRQERGRPIPTLYFSSEFEEHDFFDTVKSKKEVQALASMPQHLLKEFNNRVFEDKKKLYRITCILNNPPEEASMYSNRWVTFKYYTETPMELNLDTSVAYVDKGDERAYATYLNPLVLDVDEAGLNILYKNFYAKRTRFPLALPLSVITEKKDYFGTFKKNTRQAIRYSIREYLKQKSSDSTHSLFFLLWEMTDNPVYTEYLKEGAYFSVNSYDNSVFSETSFAGGIENNGKLQINFNLTATEKTIPKWRISLLQQDDSLTGNYDINKIKEAVADDIKRGLIGLKSDIVFNQLPLTHNWDLIQIPSFDNNYPRMLEGSWLVIEQLLDRWIDNGISNPGVIKEYIETEVLNPSAQQGAISPDHKLALRLLCDALCKFPFSNIHSFSKSNQKAYLKRADNAWQKFAFDFFRNMVMKNIKELGKITVESSTITYHENLAMEQIFYLRLGNKPNDHVRSNFTSILDYPNALDANFII